MKASCKNALRKPDAGNLHVRFEEGEGTRRSLALPHLVRPLSTLLQNLFYLLSFIPSGISGSGALMRLWLLP